ncbi:hypothetical protein V8J88_08215 [Massilia sp. W12]|uniref:hypothetical protein n=1 Tax=Massilia sp. W12 TaxID=3126507 RepID=UPI0030D1E174
MNISSQSARARAKMRALRVVIYQDYFQKEIGSVMIKVFIWLPHEQMVGHTALLVRGQYISFWPEGGADAKDIKTKRSQTGAWVASLGKDIHSEGGRQPEVIELYNLDEEAVLSFYNDYVQMQPRYQIVRNNCSHVVANCLMAGGRKPSFTPNAGHYGNLARILGIGVWTPDQILKFANELKYL